MGDIAFCVVFVVGLLQFGRVAALLFDPGVELGRFMRNWLGLAGIAGVLFLIAVFMK